MGSVALCASLTWHVALFRVYPLASSRRSVGSVGHGSVCAGRLILLLHDFDEDGCLRWRWIPCYGGHYGIVRTLVYTLTRSLPLPRMAWLVCKDSRAFALQVPRARFSSFWASLFFWKFCRTHEPWTNLLDRTCRPPSMGIRGRGFSSWT